MKNRNYRIMTITAKSLFKYFPKHQLNTNACFCLDTRKRSLYSLVVKANELEECPMLHQFLEVLKEDLGDKFNEKDNKLLYDQFLIMDFDDIFMPIENRSDVARKWREGLQENVKDLMENGFKILFDNHEVHMMPFEKSGNMSRNSRISFVNKKHFEQLNERLNLGIDFGDFKVILSKYYAYRGLYLSTSERVVHNKFEITPETVVIIKDKREASGKCYDNFVMVETAEHKNLGKGEAAKDWEFLNPIEYERFYINKPFDGEGFITPTYSKYINKALDIKGANSFQIRLPFAKGMLHQVDVVGFIKEYTAEEIGDEQYLYIDAFGIERDLRKAHILMTESMFKGKAWLEEYCEANAIEDPMQYYCDAIAKYNHGFYVSGTNLPYGHSKYTHLSYQAINTLAFDDDQFKRIMDGHSKFIKDPLEFLKSWDEIEYEDVVKEDNNVSYYMPNWKRAVLKDPSFAADKYISEQLENIQKSLLSKIALGKILVEGQTRYLCRDLAPLLFSLLRVNKDISAAYLRNLYTRFYLPQGEKNKLRLNFEDNYAFFRNPHLSRNEQYIMPVFVMPKSKNEYVNDGRKSYEKYTKYVKMYDKYFGHLTGVVMVPRGSALPLCLGGADFDGDLVSVVLNQDVVNAVARGVYKKIGSSNMTYYHRKLSVIEIPSNEAPKITVPKVVPYKHIYDTFSNYIGRISNAAISIGQLEYDRTKNIELEFDPDVPTCAKCTILTGLEIDAAKNGVHPNLDLILKNNIPKCGYLNFLKKFKQLKSEKNFYYKNLNIANKTKKHGNEEIKLIEISAAGCETKVTWNPESELSGTYINLLPKSFINNYKKCLKEGKKTNILKIKQKNGLSNRDKKLIENFNKSCDEIIQIYMFYKNKFLNKLNKEKNKGYYAVENVETMIMHMYDEIYADNILFEILPSIKEKIVKVISDKVSIQEIRERINTEQWMLQPYDRRGQVLEKIIGNGFKSTDLSDEERELLFHFNHQGYKLLWRIMDLIEGPKMATYKELFIEMEKTRTEAFSVAKIPSDVIGTYEALLIKELNIYYENNIENIEQILYEYCKDELRSVINKYASIVDDVSILVIAFYEKTKSKANKVKLFWDVFTWEEMQCIFEEKGGSAKC